MAIPAHRRVGDKLVCACPECPSEFRLTKHAMHKLYCSKRCRDMAARLAEAARDAGRNFQRLRLERDAVGGTLSDGALVCGTQSLAPRPVYDARNPPVDDARFW
ncbi:MAG TPA: hypothetical protein PKI99_07690 [Terrimesophilobacter sp.]|nr:hypothetical protein [Terrimesophilobacter sp.]